MGVVQGPNLVFGERRSQNLTSQFLSDIWHMQPHVTRTVRKIRTTTVVNTKMYAHLGGVSKWCDVDFAKSTEICPEGIVWAAARVGSWKLTSRFASRLVLSNMATDKGFFFNG